jgi:DNA polymerase-3 subunit gamma/tau
MRDAMSLLDQVIAFSGKELKADDVSRVLGVPDRKVLHELGAGLVEGNAAKVLKTLDGMATQGFDMGHVAKDVLHHLRNLVVAKVTPGSRDLLDLADEEAADVEALVQNADLDDLLRLFQGFSKAFEDIMELGHVRASLEMALVRLAHRPPLRPIDELLVRLGDLEKRLTGGAPAPSRGTSSRGRSAPEPVTGMPERPNFTSTLTSPGIERPKPPSPSSDMKPRSSAAPAVSLPQPEEATPLPPSAQRLSAPVDAPVVQLVPPASSESLDRFRAIVVAIRVVRPHLASLLEHAYVIEIGPDRLRLGFEQGHFAADQVALPAERAVLEREARAILGANAQITIEPNIRTTPRSSTLAAVDKEKRDSDTAKARAEVESHPAVQKIIQLFGAEIRDIKIPESD